MEEYKKKLESITNWMKFVRVSLNFICAALIGAIATLLIVDSQSYHYQALILGGIMNLLVILKVIILKELIRRGDLICEEMKEKSVNNLFKELDKYFGKEIEKNKEDK